MFLIRQEQSLEIWRAKYIFAFFLLQQPFNLFNLAIYLVISKREFSGSSV